MHHPIQPPDGLSKSYVDGPLSAPFNTDSGGQVLYDPAEELTSSFMVQSPSDACIDILTHEGMVRQTMVKEAMGDGVPRQRQVGRFIDLKDADFLRPHSLDQLVVKMFRSIASIEKWKMMAHFCSVTNGWNKLGPITRWRIEPTVENYLKLPLCYRPTESQLTIPHWPIIDWNPFPRVRDALIRNRELYDLTDVCAHLNFSFCLESEVPGQNSPFNGPSQSNPDGDAMDQPGDPFLAVSDFFNQASPGDMFSGAPLHDSSNGFPQRPHVTTKVYFMVQEYVDYQRFQIDHPDQPLPRLDEEAAAQLLLAFRQRENAFKLHPDFFHMFPFLYNQDDLVKGQPRSIYLDEQG